MVWVDSALKVWSVRLRRRFARMAYSDLSSVNGEQLISSKQVHICREATATALSLYLSYPRF